jgi:hypothetical protein
MYLIKHHALMDSEVEVQLHIFLTLALGAGDWSPSFLGSFTPRKRAPDTPR